MACPWFYPEARIAEESTLYPPPLGHYHDGLCRANGSTPVARSHALQCCNGGYADCDALPGQRAADSHRFGIQQSEGTLIEIVIVRERDHRPVDRAVAQYDSARKTLDPQLEAVLARQAAAFAESYLCRVSRVGGE